LKHTTEVAQCFVLLTVETHNRSSAVFCITNCRWHSSFDHSKPDESLL